MPDVDVGESKNGVATAPPRRYVLVDDTMFKAPPVFCTVAVSTRPEKVAS